MSGKTWRGYWWLPSTPGDKAPGQLVVSDDGSCQLELVGGLDLWTADPARSEVGLSGRVPVILGEAEGQLITLLDCLALKWDGFGRRLGGCTRH